jgi:hypothetical protein
MEYTVNIITRNEIPNNIYLCEGIDKDWDMIHSFEFKNGLKYIIGSNNSITSAELIIEDISHEFELVLNKNDPADYQSYYYNTFNEFINYKDCCKIWNYYHDNMNLIKELINAFYKETGIFSD